MEFTWLIMSSLLLAIGNSGSSLVSDSVLYNVPYSTEYRLEQMYTMTTWDIQKEITGDALQKEYLQKQKEEQKEIITEWYFDWLERLGRINYALGCAWNATDWCSSKSFDCSWLIKYYGYWKKIFSIDEIKHYNSSTLFNLWSKKDPRTAERWDLTFWIWEWVDENWDSLPNHIAVVTRAYETGWIWIMDNLKWVWEERFLKMHCNDRYCNYIWKRNIYVASNWLFEEAQRRWIVVEKYIDDRDVIDWKIKSFLSKKLASNLYKSFIKYWYEFNTKPEIWVCIALSETNFGKNMTFKGNIGNVWSHDARVFVDENWNEDIDRWIKAIFQVA